VLNGTVFTLLLPIELLEGIYIDLYALLLQNDPSVQSALNSLSESMVGQPLPLTTNLVSTIEADIAVLADRFLTA
jgi:hypothetical protein